MTYLPPTWEVVFSVLIANLGADDYRQRSAAHAALDRLAPLVASHLHVLENAKDREVATRARQILNRYYAEHAAEWAAATLPTNYPRLPWIGEFPDAELDQGLGQYYLERARKQIGIQGPPEWNDYRLATRLLVEDLYRQRVSRARIIVILDRLSEAETQWLSHHGHRFDPPIRVSLGKRSE
jgi:hypothetical protein